jgi:uncharacterized RDD family membrane protein YckC
MRRRVQSWLWDYLVLLGWLVVVFLVVGVPQLAGWFDLAGLWSGLVVSDIAITLLTVIPFLIYLSATETGPRHATWGKRKARLRVFDGRGDDPGSGAVWIRNIAKLLPWQSAHMGIEALVRNGGSSIGKGFIIGALVLLVAVAGPPLAGRRGMHDVIAGTVVRPGFGGEGGI